MMKEITTSLVTQLIVAQFPKWAHLEVASVEFDGRDNRTFRLGEELCVRFPSAERYAPQVDKEHRWLPVLAPHLPLSVPIPVAMGRPAFGYPWQWSVYRWLEGEDARRARIDDVFEFASRLGRFLMALQRIDATGGPPAGSHNFHRGGPLATYDAETRTAIGRLGDDVDGTAIGAVWDAALGTRWQGPPVWVHGDVSAANLLVRNGRLCAVIDFGSTGVGDPACDLTMAWTFFSDENRDAFREAVSLDDATWTRAHGWALWKALVTLLEYGKSNPTRARAARRVLDAVLVDAPA